MESSGLERREHPLNSGDQGRPAAPRLRIRPSSASIARLDAPRSWGEGSGTMVAVHIRGLSELLKKAMRPAESLMALRESVTRELAPKLS